MRKLAWIVLIVFTVVSLVSCAKSEPRLKSQQRPDVSMNDVKEGVPEAAQNPPEQKTLMEETAVRQANIVLYFLDNTSNKLVSETRQVSVIREDELPGKIIRELISGPKTQGLERVLPKGTQVKKVEQAENILTVNLSSDFLESSNLLVARAALVNTLTEVDGIKYVKIYVDGKELTSNGKDDGEIVGLLTRYPMDVKEILDQEAQESLSPNIREVDRELYFRDSQGMYLLAEARTITMKNNQLARAIVEELIKGPLNTKEGLFPTIPQGTQLLDIKLVSGEDGETEQGLELYFSKDFADQFPTGSSEELTSLGSIVYSLTDLPNIQWVKIFYQNEAGEFVDEPISHMDLTKPLTREDFGNILGRKLKVYFTDKGAMNLVPEYRAMSRDNAGVANKIISELVMGPMVTDHTPVLPPNINIRVWMEGDTAVVDLPLELDGNQLGSSGEIMALYSIVNSLTDQVNTKNINQVQFLINGKKAENFGNMSLVDPFYRNPALIKE